MILPLKPVFKHYLWGGRELGALFGYQDGDKTISESWEISVHPDGKSMLEDRTLADFLEREPQAVFPNGGAFPLLIKYIDAAQNLSVQVHPSDEYARRVESDNGKTEMWYVIRAAQHAGIYCGFRRDTSREEFLSALAEGRTEELLNFIPVQAGDCFLIKAGTVHAICAGCVICEVQESSNVTYRVYDYDRRDANGNARPLHIARAMDVIDFKAFRDETGRGPSVQQPGGSVRLLTDCGYFRCRELLLDGLYRERAVRSFLAVNVIEGAGRIGDRAFVAGNSFFVPCGEEMTLCGKGKVILTDVPGGAQ